VILINDKYKHVWDFYWFILRAVSIKKFGSSKILFTSRNEQNTVHV